METQGLEMVREYLLGEYDDVQLLANDDNALFECELKELGEVHQVIAEPFYNDNGFGGFELIGEHNGRSWEVGMIRL